MNKDYAEIGRLYSDSGIFEGYYRERRKSTPSLLCTVRAAVIGHFRSLCSVLRSAVARRIFRAVSATTALIGTVGTAGALESGKLSPVGCLLLSAAMLFIVYLSLKPRKKAAEQKSAYRPAERPQSRSASTSPASAAADFASSTVLPAEPISSRSE